MTTDAARAENFYSNLLGWRVEETRKTGALSA
jgi:predicted enzyme related to lactoylglutathione lyase